MMFVFILFSIIILLLFLDCKKPNNFPPGPRWYPIVGCGPQISLLQAKCGLLSKAMDELAKTFANPHGVYGLKMGRDKIVVVHGDKSIQEMGYNYDFDGRPNGMFYKMRTFNSKKGILLVDEELWLEQRRFILHKLKEFGFSRKGIIAYIQEEIQFLVEYFRKKIADEGGKEATIDMSHLFPLFAINSLWRIMASKRYDQGINEVTSALMSFHEVTKNVTMIGATFSHYPLLRYIAPGYSGYTDYQELHNTFYSFLRKEVQEHREKLNLNDPPKDLMDAYLLEMSKPNHSEFYTEEQLLSVCLDLFHAGSETVSKCLDQAFLHMVINPEIQKKAQEELDAAIGRERLPTWEDRVNLPYCEAIVYEALRFFMGFTFGVPHRAVRDTKLCGYDIPKNTVVAACHRGILMNEKMFPEPHVFRPERYFINGKFETPKFSAFGFGRHRCLGEIHGKQTVFLFVTTIMQSFTFKVRKGDPLPDPNLIDGLLPSVKDYYALVIPREM